MIYHKAKTDLRSNLQTIKYLKKFKSQMGFTVNYKPTFQLNLQEPTRNFLKLFELLLTGISLNNDK